METLNRQDQTMVHLTINNIPCCAPAGSTILEAAHAAGIAIPTLCYLKGVNEIGACRMCVVEVRGRAIWFPPVSIPLQREWRYLPTPKMFRRPAEPI